MRLMGIVNATPDSFSDGGRMGAAAVAHALALCDAGADILDIGGESTRPGAAPVSAAEELDRVIPVVEAIRAARPAALLSVDTRRASVARAAVAAGARMINDVSAGADPEMFSVMAALTAAGGEAVLMHMRGEPATMMREARYKDVVAEVRAELLARRAAAVAAGVVEARILLDPGIGFAKDTDQNLALLRALPIWTGARVLLGASNKRFIGAITGQERAAARLEGSLAVAIRAREAGVEVLRVHDVAATRRALLVWQAVTLREEAGEDRAG